MAQLRHARADRFCSKSEKGIKPGRRIRPEGPNQPPYGAKVLRRVWAEKVKEIIVDQKEPWTVASADPLCCSTQVQGSVHAGS